MFYNRFFLSSHRAGKVFFANFPKFARILSFPAIAYNSLILKTNSVESFILAYTGFKTT